jgi:hypothetical protein
MPDPALQLVIDELNAVLKRHDVGAIVLLASKTHTHYLHQLGTSWNCIWFEGDMLRIRCKRQDFPSADAQKEVLSHTIGMLGGLVDAARQEADKFEELLRMIGQSGVEFDHVSQSEDKPRNMTDTQKARAFEVLVHHIAQVLPPEAAIKQMAGIPLVEALQGYVFVSKEEWERLHP